MEYRNLGITGLRVSALGFGCGNVGGLMIRGTPAERERAVARAMELGINYFDTAPSYGNGQSEQNLGQVLRTLKANVSVGTKFRVDQGDLSDVSGAVARSLEASLRRLGLERVTLLQCHNHIFDGTASQPLRVQDFLGEVVPALEKLRTQGKLQFFGITALGDTDALHRVIDSGAINTAQVCYNLLQPSPGAEVPAGFPAQNFRQLLSRARERRVGVINIRVLAAGALSGVATRHPVAVPTVDPIASGPDYSTDVERTRFLQPLVDEGHAASLVEASLRFPLASDAVSTVLLGYSSLDHLEYAASCIAKGPLSSAAQERLRSLWAQIASRAPAG